MAERSKIFSSPRLWLLSKNVYTTDQTYALLKKRCNSLRTIEYFNRHYVVCIEQLPTILDLYANLVKDIESRV